MARQGELPELLIGDPTRLRQILINLLGNAVKFTQRGSVTLELHCRSASDARIQVQFTVRDTGIGITPENRQRIFEAFQQSDSSVTREFGGTGLGLSISQRLVSSMGGEISVDSELKKGSCFQFTVTFPRPDEQKICLLPHFEALGTGKVLVLEDHSGRRKLLCWLLRRWGLQAECASSAEEAKVFFEKRKQPAQYAAVIVEENLGGANGYDAVAGLIGRDAIDKCAVLVLCAPATMFDKLAASDRRIFRRLGKPVLCGSLYENLGDALHLKKPRRGSLATPPQLMGRKLKVLVVEDNEVNQKLAVHVLTKMGHAVLLATNGAKGFEAAKADTFNLVLMDLQMPLMGGLQATRLIREYEKQLGRRTPIVAMTAHAAAQDERRCLEAGMDGYLTKPVKWEDLQREMERVFGGAKPFANSSSDQAEDDPMSRTLLERALKRGGYEVTAVEDGRLALQQLASSDPPRMALLDWVMPHKTGIDVCAEVRLKKDKAYTYLILLSSKESKQDIVQGLEAGADDYLTKPFDVEELKARLRAGERILELEDRLVEARESMRFQATHDLLTSLWNRGVIMELMSREVHRSQREKNCTAVMLCDIDHFKRVNDEHGHSAGDDVPSEVARRLHQSVRSYDMVGRYGGEEFLVVLNQCDPQSATARAENLREMIARRPIVARGKSIPVTVSIGVALSTDFGNGEVDEIVQEADAALYAAKREGRNCVRVAGRRASGCDDSLIVKTEVTLRAK